MATASRRYSYRTDGSAALQRQQVVRNAAPERQPKRGVRVLPGSQTKTDRNAQLDPRAITAFKLLMVAAAVLALAFGLRVWMTVQTVQVMQSIEVVESNIDAARAAGTDLEIQHSVLASPDRIAKAATALGMAQPAEIVRITVPLPAAPAYYPDGSLSLAGSLANAINSVRTY